MARPGVPHAEPTGNAPDGPAFQPNEVQPIETVFARVRQAAGEASGAIRFEERAGTLELSPVRRARCRLKIFRPREGKERLCAFFYKKSNLAWSRDRYSYGAVEFRPEQLTDSDMRAWLDWLTGGFDPGRRPPRLKKAFLYSIPD